MEDPIVIRFRWTAEELLRASRWNFRHSCRPALRATLPVMWALLLIAGLLGLRKGSVIPHSLALGFLAGALCWLVMRVLRKWFVRRNFSKRPDRDIDIEARAASDSFSIECSLSQGTQVWDSFAKVVRAPDGILLYPTNEIFHWFPRSGFASDADFERFATLAENKISKCYKVH
jgi:hypothetical protein